MLQLDLDEVDDPAVDMRACGHVLARLRGRLMCAEFICLRVHGHRGDHEHTLIERVRPTETVAVAGGVI